MLSDMAGNIVAAWTAFCGALVYAENETIACERADVAIVYLSAEQSDAEVTESTVAAEGRRCLLIPGDVRDSSIKRRSRI
jgi:hypothetical protein